jgi:hypothetical protein
MLYALIPVFILVLGSLALACLIVGSRKERSWRERNRMPDDDAP